MYKRIKSVLAAVSRIIIAAPMKLPGKVVAVAKYVALAIGLLDAMDKQQDDESEPTT